MSIRTATHPVHYQPGRNRVVGGQGPSSPIPWGVVPNQGSFPIIAFAAKAVTIPYGRFTSSR
jgi:hypothetical protein